MIPSAIRIHGPVDQVQATHVFRQGNIPHKLMAMGEHSQCSHPKDQTQISEPNSSTKRTDIHSQAPAQRASKAHHQ
jgi:hypothetical protein